MQPAAMWLHALEACIVMQAVRGLQSNRVVAGILDAAPWPAHAMAAGPVENAGFGEQTESSSACPASRRSLSACPAPASPPHHPCHRHGTLRAQTTINHHGRSHGHTGSTTMPQVPDPPPVLPHGAASNWGAEFRRCLARLGHRRLDSEPGVLFHTALAESHCSRFG